ncbi:fungal-specific transcription factor domain-containing protein [Dichotomocladium elegans]|nr:fungal-specific transcription factor domain-containing protein [Dichotomocladium elegans]
MIQAYFRHVHPYAPMISKIVFLEQYYFQNPHPPDEYLVYAICAIACQFMIREGNPIMRYGVSPETLLSLHQVFREKAEKLLTIVYRRSKISTIQTLILLATFVNTSQDKDDDMLQWFTCGTAIRMAQDLGLHRSSSRWRLPETEIELRRRVWYAAYILDREISAELGRPVTVNDDDFDVEIPTPYELEFPHCLYARDPEASGFMPQILLDAEEDVAEKRETYKSFVANCHLAKILGRVLHTLNSPKGQQIYPAIIAEIDISLAEWAAKFIADYSNLDQQAAPWNRAMMIYYHCMQILLHRSSLGNHDPNNIQHALQALSASTTSATKIIEYVEEGEACGYICLPWSIVSYSVFQAALVFLFNAKGENEYLRDLGAKNLARCAYIYTKDETYRDSRPAKLLMSLAARFSVQMDQPLLLQQQQQPESRKRDFGTAQSESFESGLCDRAEAPVSHLPSSQKHDYSASADALFYHGLTLFPPSVPSQPVYLGSNSNVQFDVASLSSEVALWNASSGMTWNDWGPYLHNSPSPPQQQPHGSHP